MCDPRKNSFGAGLYGVVAFCIMLLSFTALSGCGSSKAASDTTNKIEVLALAYASKTDAREKAFIADYKANARSRVDELVNDALSKEVDSNGNAKANNVVAILKIKSEHYSNIEKQCLELQRNFDSDRKDIDTLVKYTGALKGYFENKTSTAEIIKATSATIIEELGSLVNVKITKPAAKVSPPEDVKAVIIPSK